MKAFSCKSVGAKKADRCSFSRGISPIERKWILESIDFLKGLGIPTSEDIHFKHITGYKLIGGCFTGEGSVGIECTIGLSVHLMIDGGDERAFKEMCIHELPHTTRNRAKDPIKDRGRSGRTASIHGNRPTILKSGI